MTMFSGQFPVLAIEAGNSRVKFGVFEATQSPLTRDVWPECRQFQAIAVHDQIPWDHLTQWMMMTNHKSVIAGSNPSEVERLRSGWNDRGWAPPMIVAHYSAIPVTQDVDYPDKVGHDRLLNAVAANVLRPEGHAAIIINSGTATTIDYVSRTGVFCGGAILPGLEMSARALHHYTSLLPQLPVQELGGSLPITPGRNTREAIRNGLFWGQVGAIRELIRQTCIQRGHDLPISCRLSDNRRFGNPQGDHSASSTECDGIDSTCEKTSPWLVLTGGGAPVLSGQFPDVLHLPSIGMHGLVLTAWNRIASQIENQ